VPDPGLLPGCGLWVDTRSAHRLAELPVVAVSGVFEEASAVIVGLAVHVASIREHLPLDAVRARSLMVMCEEDLLSAVDAWEKATADLTLDDLPAGTTYHQEVPRASSKAQPAVRPARRARKVCEGQQQLFAATGI